MKAVLLSISILTVCCSAATVSAQTPTAPAPAAAVSPAPAPAAPNPPVQQGNMARDANGNAIPPQPAVSSQGNATQAVGAAGYSSPAAPTGGPTITPFAILDQAKDGAIKLDQARGDAWLAQHFVECDTNHNDEVTQSEYETCTAARH